MNEKLIRFFTVLEDFFIFKVGYCNSAAFNLVTSATDLVLHYSKALIPQLPTKP